MNKITLGFKLDEIAIVRQKEKNAREETEIIFRSKVWRVGDGTNKVSAIRTTPR